MTSVSDAPVVSAPSSPGRTVSAEVPWLLNEGSTLTFERADWRHEDTFLRLIETPVALMSVSRQAFLFFFHLLFPSGIISL